MDKLGPYLLGPNDKNQGIYTGDARELARAIPDESVDLIFTDPVYQNIEDYRWLAETAARVLKPDSACLAWTATASMPEAMRELGKHLSWAWCMYWNRSADVTFYPGRPGICVITPCLWFEKGKTRRHAIIADMMRHGWDNSNSSNHLWSKPIPVISKWAEMASVKNEIVFDPFTGGGTVPAVCKMLGRKWLAFEIEPDTAEQARERVRNTQPPLFVMEPEQMEMGL